MDAKMKGYIGKGLAGLTVVIGLNALFGGDSITISDYALLPILAIITPIVLILGNKKKG